MRPIVTFVTATVGRDTLTRACDSVDAQSNPQWNHIVAGDGVDPGVAPGVRRTVLEYPRYRHESKVRNKAIEGVTTPWTAFLDDDDTLSPHYVRWLREVYDGNAAVDVVIFRQTLSIDLQHCGDTIIPSRPEIVWGNVGISYAVKTEWARQVPFKETRHEDLLQLVALEAAGAEIQFSDHIAYFGRDHRP